MIVYSVNLLLCVHVVEQFERKVQTVVGLVVPQNPLGRHETTKNGIGTFFHDVLERASFRMGHRIINVLTDLNPHADLCVFRLSG